MDFIERFDEEWAGKLGVRAMTFRAVLAEMMRHKHSIVLETGCTRQLDNWAGDGQSTVIWSEFAKHELGRYSTVDISEEATDIAKGICAGNIFCKVTCSDSISYLARQTSCVDVLYLDSYDVDMANPHDAALHCFMEFTAAKHLLGRDSIVFVDDSPINSTFEVQGKGLYLGQYMRHLGIRPFAFGYQAAWLMP